jgi:ssDNA-binding Zn-finger/Zn-ribbon topoisomerase 1
MAVTVKYLYQCDYCAEPCVYATEGDYTCPDCGKKHMQKVGLIGGETTSESSTESTT